MTNITFFFPFSLHKGIMTLDSSSFAIEFLTHLTYCVFLPELVCVNEVILVKFQFLLELSLS